MRDANSNPQVEAYLRLMRLYKPTGIWLLMWPCWWSVAMASPGLPPVATLLWFLLGAFLMRPAGCIVNDIADRKLDAKVARTTDRPIASGDITVGEAWRLVIWLLFLAFWVAYALGENVIYWSAAALPLVVLYPWMKRITWWPQLFLGLTFSWGALLGWVAIRGHVELPALLIYAGGVCWALGYDTIYAHQDKADDAAAGVKSSALRLGRATKPALVIFYTLAIASWAAAGFFTGLEHMFYYGFLAVGWMHFFWQVRMVDLDDPASCQRIFAANSLIGWIVFAAILAGKS